MTNDCLVNKECRICRRTKAIYSRNDICDWCCTNLGLPMAITYQERKISYEHLIKYLKDREKNMNEYLFNSRSVDKELEINLKARLDEIQSTLIFVEAMK